jgi:outer membrane protein OmpA-like peptidoglycan-associated protein
MKNLLTRSTLLLLVGMLAFATTNVHAQSKEGTIAFGFNAGGNKYYGDYTDSRFEFQGEAFIRWNMMDWLSLHAAYNAGVLGWKTTDQMIANEVAQFPNSTGSSGGAIGSINHTRVGGWDLMLSANVFPSQTFVPFFIAGVEALNFEPDDASPSPLRGNAAGAYSKNVIGGAFGVGFEMYLSPKITFNGKGLLHLTGTDWIDDHSDPVNYRQDAFLTMGLGFSYYIFAPDEPTPVVADAYSERTVIHDITEKTIYHNDTIYVKEAGDTIYVMNPKVNTIFNFPGTLFIVNTDQFNTAEPNNMSNLYEIKHLVNQCPALRVEIQGFASDEGTTEHNQQLSEQRAARIQSWLISQGVNSSKIVRTVGFGETNNAVHEGANVSAKTLEAQRTQNRRIAVRVVQSCS